MASARKGMKMHFRVFIMLDLVGYTSWGTPECPAPILGQPEISAWGKKSPTIKFLS